MLTLNDKIENERIVSDAIDMEFGMGAYQGIKGDIEAVNILLQYLIFKNTWYLISDCLYYKRDYVKDEIWQTSNLIKYPELCHRGLPRTGLVHLVHGGRALDFILRCEMSKYTELFKDPRWQKKRLEILSRDEFTCVICCDKESTLHVHHRRYISGRKPWEYDNDLLVTLCHDCHERETESRNECEGILLEQLREKFFSEDLRIIAAGVCYMKMISYSDHIASSLAYAMENNEILKYITDECQKRIEGR